MKNKQPHTYSSHRYQSVVQELNQMLKQNPSNVQKPEQASEKHTDKFKYLLSNSATGVKEFDELLDGGFPKGAVVLLAGSSGSGKTIFASQWLFEGVKNNENGIYITLTEPLFKILENLEKMNYYDRKAIEQERLKIIDLRESYAKNGFSRRNILNFIEEQVKQTNAKRLCIDSITAIAYHLNDKSQIRTFIFELGTILAALGCTTILTSEVAHQGKYSMYDVEEFISDAIIRLDQIKVKNEFQRTMHIVKVRGKSYRAEALPLKISKDGIKIFPEIHPPLNYVSTGEKISTGNLVLDEMLQGGFIQGSTTLAAGSTGTGKTLLCLQFIMDGLKKGEPCLYAGFEESKEQLTRNAKNFGWNLEKYEKKGLLALRGVYPSDKLLEEHLKDIKQVVDDNNIKRCVIDSLSSISHAFDEEAFSSFVIRLNGYLKVHGVTSFFTTATGSLIGSTALAENNLSTLTDSILMLRYVEMQGKLESVINILKMRGSGHCKDLRKYDISNKGIVIGPPLSDYEGIMTGSSKKIRELEKEGERLKKIIKEKDEMEKGLKESEERYRTIFENSAVGIMLTDENERVISWNKFAENLLGMSKDDLNMKPVEMLYPPEEWRKIRSENVRQKGMHYHLETRMLKKNNEAIDVYLSLKILKDHDGKTIGSIGVIEDITDRKKMERDMRIKDSAISSSINAIALVDLDGEITYVNPSFLEMWRYNFAEEILGKTAVKLWHRKGQYMDVVDAAFNKGGWVGELIAERMDGSLFDAQLSANIVKDENNKPICMMISFVDNTKLKKLEEAVRGI